MTALEITKDRSEQAPPKHEITDAYRTEKVGNRVEWTDGRNRCQVTDLPIWTNQYRLQFLDNLGVRVFKDHYGFLVVEIDMRLLKLFNDRYGETTANKALVQFTEALIAKLDEWTANEENAEYYLYKLRDGGDDYSLSISASKELLERIFRELPVFLDSGIPDFVGALKKKSDEKLVAGEDELTPIEEKNEEILQATNLGAECGMSLIPAGDEAISTLLKVQKESDFPRDRRRNVNEIRGIDLHHDIMESHKHVASKELAKSKFLQIFTELENGDNLVRKAVKPAYEEIKLLFPPNFEERILALTQLDPAGMSQEELSARVSAIEQLVMHSNPFESIKPLYKEGDSAAAVETARIDAKTLKREIKALFELTMNNAFQELPKLFGERRKSPACEAYTIALVRICQDLITRVKGELPIPPKLLNFLGVIHYDTTIRLSNYVLDLLKRQNALNRTAAEDALRERGIPIVRKSTPDNLKDLLEFTYF